MFAKKPCKTPFPNIVLLSFLSLNVFLQACNPEGQVAQIQQEPTVLTEEQKRLPENALHGLEVTEGLQVNLFAHEPLLVNPTNMAVDARGRVWICEALNYRPKLNPDNPLIEEGDRIVVLEDTDGDGVADQSTVFYQGPEINAALGIAVLGNRVIVSCSPNIFIFTDENGDGKADKKEVLFTAEGGVQDDHGIHAFIFGPDGKLYFNHGNGVKQLMDKDGSPLKTMDGQVVSNKLGKFRQGMAYRCNPDGSELEVLGHNFRNSYELSVDSYGSIWQSDNDDDGNRSVRINFILEYGNYGYTDEMTGAGWRTRRTNMEADIPERHWHQNDPGVVPNMLVTGAGSPAGLLVYEGDVLPEPFQNQLIHCDAGPNVVRAYPVQKAGAGYQAAILDLVKSTDDAWFRPIDVCAAPDGTLLVADWYDPGVGGHQVGDLEKGRVYRIAPTGWKPGKAATWDFQSAEGAVVALQNPNMDVRYQAWQALHKMGKGAEPALQGLLTHQNPRMRARALWLLAKIPGRAEHYIGLAMADPLEELRITGLRIARNEQPAALHQWIAKAVADTSLPLRREAAIALRNLDHPQAPALWAQLANTYQGNDRWFLEALGIGSDTRPDECFEALVALRQENLLENGGIDLIWRVRSTHSIAYLHRFITHPSVDEPRLLAFFRALDFHKHPSKDDLLASILTQDYPKGSPVKLLALQHISKERVERDPVLKRELFAAMETMKGTERFVDWVKRFKLTNYQQELVKIYMAEPYSKLGIDAIRIIHSDLGGLPFFESVLAKGTEEEVISTLIGMSQLWGTPVLEAMKKVAFDTSRPMKIRRQAIQSLGTGWANESYLYELLQAGKVPKELEEVAINTLMAAIKSSIRNGATALMKTPLSEDIAPISELVALRGDIFRGRNVYERACASCHQVNGFGISFGPELSEIGNKLSRDGMYAAIISPDAGISFGFEGYLFEIASGEKTVGYIASKTEHALDVRKMGGITTTYARADIRKMTPLENSLMTPGLHKTMSQSELVDLVEYLMSLKEAEKLALR
jgi:putative membrane-bound dehydrogenase-like protein